MRADANDHIELYFDCGATPGGAIKRTEVAGTQHLRIENLTANIARVSTGYASIPSGLNVLCLNLRGTLIGRVGSQGRLVLAPPRSLTFVRGTRLILQAARGEHHSMLITWPSVVAPLLEHWIASRSGPNRSNGGMMTRNVACKPIDPHFKDAVERMEKAIEAGGDTLEPLIVSVLYEVVARMMIGMDQVQLAAIPLTLPETIKELVAKVRTNPAAPWPLKDAADMAGYSPFHFSRVFKSMVGYGFHEYVDRCRTECAVEMLCTTDHAVDLVASTCGFGTTQGLRESVKEYLGLVPSELRSVPETFDTA
ncbi:MAG TPA: helix-turn-helix transcriptional regulator [Fimbriimonas sp.]|nr:helix-turn-helix transcriptional regulator [Fimbriimonas sp.]